MKKLPKLVCPVLISVAAVSCSDNSPGTAEDGRDSDRFAVSHQDQPQIELRDLRSARLKAVIERQLGVGGMDSLVLPESYDFAAIPQDANNRITFAKVILGQLLFHDTGFALNGRSLEVESWSCATCHNAEGGFKPGIPQGIAEGGVGFGHGGTDRVLASAFDGDARSDAANRPDIQPISPPATLNAAYQDVVLWNGQLGNAAAGSPNSGVPLSILAPDGTPAAANSRQLSGLETQAIAGIGVHRLKVDTGTPLQTNNTYQLLWREAYGGDALSGDVLGNAGKAIAAFERTVLANRSPFQLWLRGDVSAMGEAEYRGAELFFGKAGCSGCHQGPALSSRPGASEDEMFFAIGFADLDTSDPRIHGSVPVATSKGRGGFTGLRSQEYQFKIPQLYNLADFSFFGHGASFSSIRELLVYKNQAFPQTFASLPNLDYRFVPLGLSATEMYDLEKFLTDALYDPDLERYQPDTAPSGECLIVDPLQFDSHGLCP